MLNLSRSVLGASICALSVAVSGSVAASPAQNTVRADIEAACELVANRYAYHDKLALNLDSFCNDMANEAADKQNSVPVLEKLIASLRDNHVSLNTNTSVSPRLVPTGADYTVQPNGKGKAIITGVRPGSSAALAGLSPGDKIVAIDGRPIDSIVTAWDAYWSGDRDVSLDMVALNQAAAGRRGTQRSLTLKTDQGERQIHLKDPVPQGQNSPVTCQILSGNTLYLRFNNSLGDADTVAAFDSAITDHMNTRRWIIDLRDTPSGGDTDVAEPILGRFIEKRSNYQRYGTPDSGYIDRYVDPRGPWTITGNVIILVGNWTGSMGEGLAVGFDALGVGDVVGSRMAGLRGGIENLDLPSGLTLRLPTYDLTHMDGTPRHDWMPPYKQVADNGSGPDKALAQAIWMLSEKED